MLTLRRAPALVAEAPALDPSQRAVLAADAPVVRVLGGPGTGRSTLGVELVLDRVDRLGHTPDECLLLAPTRLAAAAISFSLVPTTMMLWESWEMEVATAPCFRP